MNGDPFGEYQPLRPGMRVSEALKAARFNALANTANAGAQGTNLRAGPGLRWSYGPQGPRLSLMRRPMARAGAQTLPLDCYVAGTSDGSAKLQVRPGTILSVMPTIGGTRLDDATPPYLVLPTSGTRYVVFNLTMTFSIAGDIFTRPTLVDTAATITLESSDPGSGGARAADGSFHFLLATFVDGVRTLQNGWGPITGELCDTLEGTHTAQLNLQYPGS